MADKVSTPTTGGMSKLQKVVLCTLIVALIGSVAARAAILSKRPEAASGASSALQPSSYVASGEKSASTAQHDEQAGALERSLPFVTEASLFALIGFALGYATRKVFKLALLVIALVFIAIQTLSYFNLLDVEWGGVVGWINKAILNLKENESITKFLTRRVPSVGSLVVGYFLGFRRG